MTATVHHGSGTSAGCWNRIAVITGSVRTRTATSHRPECGMYRAKSYLLMSHSPQCRPLLMLPNRQLNQTTQSSRLWLLAVALTAILCATSGYYRAFSTFAEYDDEGYVMLSLKQHLQGGALFDDVYTQYGPAWYTTQSWFHQATGLAVTHDITRCKTVAVWMLAAGLCSLVVWRTSQSKATSLAAFVLSFLHLERLTSEPGHPQELCLLAMLGVLAVATNRRGMSKRNVIVMAIVTGIAVMTKLNVGLLMVAALTLTMSLTASTRRQRLLLTIVSATLIAAGAFVVTRSTFGENKGLWLPLVVAFSVLPLSFVACRQSNALVGFTRHGAFHVTWILVAAAFCALTWMQGTSTHALLHGLVLQHLGFADRFYTAAPLYGFAAPFAVAAAVGTIWLRASDERWSRWLPVVVRYARLASLVLFVGIAQRHFADLGTPIEHGLDDRGHAGLLMSLVVPMSWLIIVGHVSRSGRQQFGRVALACTAVVQPLIAYPTPGTQMAMGSLPLLLIVLVMVHDFIRAETERATTNSWFGTTLRRAVVVAPMMLIALSVSYRWQQYEDFEPLNLAGAERLRMHPVLAEQTREVVRQLRTNGDTFVSLHNGYNSLYLWADLEPPTGLNATFWPWMLSDEQQKRVVAALKRSKRVCCVEKVIPERPEPPSTPLGDFCESGFKTHATIGLWQVRIPASN